MLARCFLTFTVVALMPLTGWSGPGFDPQSRDQSWRVLVEGDASVVPTMIEELRKSANEHNLMLVTVAKASDTYDLRIIMTYGEGKAWDNDPLRKIGEIRFPVSFAFSSIAVLSSDGRLLFTDAQSGNTRKTSVAAVAREAIKRMTDPGFTQHRSPKVTSKELSNQPERAKPSDISSSEREEQPGVYYKAADGLHTEKGWSWCQRPPATDLFCRSARLCAPGPESRLG